MNVTFVFQYSAEHVNKVLVETGERLNMERKMKCDAKALTPAHRQRFLASSSGYPKIDGDTEKLTQWKSWSDLWQHNGPIDDPNVVLDAYCLYCDENKREEEEREETARVAREKYNKKREAEKQAREAEKQAREAELKSWAVENGSELLKARVEGGFEWEKLAGKEYARSIVDSLDLGLTKVTGENWPRAECTGYDDRTTPTLEEIKSLNRVRDAARDLGNVTASLVWVDYESEEEYRDDDDLISQCEIRIEVKDPVGKEHKFYFLP